MVIVSSADNDPSGVSELARADDWNDNKPRCFAPTSNDFRDRLRRPLYQHFQSAMLGVIYPLIMKEVGMNYLALASLASVYNTMAVLDGDHQRGQTHYGIGPALSVTYSSCLLAMGLLMLLRMPRKDGASASPSSVSKTTCTIAPHL